MLSIFDTKCSKLKTTEQNENDRTKFLIQKWCFASNLLIENAERHENEVEARVKSVIAARISVICPFQ